MTRRAGKSKIFREGQATGWKFCQVLMDTAVFSPKAVWRKNSFFLLLGPQVFGCGPTTLWRVISFI